MPIWARKPQDSPAPDVLAVVPRLSILGPAILIKGNITSREPLQIDGEVEGTLELPESRLIVGPQGRIRAKASAREIEVAGTVVGDLEATRKIIVRRGGHITGDLHTPRIVVDEDADLTGRVEIVESEPQAKPMAAAPNVNKAAVGA